MNIQAKRRKKKKKTDLYWKHLQRYSRKHPSTNHPCDQIKGWPFRCKQKTT